MYITLQEFLFFLNQHGRSKNTLDAYKRNITSFIEWMENITNEPFNNIITQLDARLYDEYLTKQKQSFNTINSKLTAIRNYSDYLADNGYMPFIKIPLKKGNVDPKVEVLEKNELYKYLRFTISSGNKLSIAIVMLILNTGIRASELCSLELDDIVITERKGLLKIRSGKGDKYREVPLNKDVREHLLNYIEYARPNTNCKQIFIGQRGALTRNAIYKIINKIGMNSINKNVYPHMLRHQCFTTMAKNPNVDLKTISELAGHSNVELTAKYYIHSSREEKETAIEELNFFA